jgi:hypothetical protein
MHNSTFKKLIFYKQLFIDILFFVIIPFKAKSRFENTLVSSFSHGILFRNSTVIFSTNKTSEVGKYENSITNISVYAIVSIFKTVLNFNLEQFLFLGRFKPFSIQYVERNENLK